MTEENFELPEALDFDSCCELFVDLGGKASPSELHGQLAGYLSAGAVFTREQWLKLAADFLDLDEVPQGIMADELEEFYQVTSAWLNHGSMQFKPLLADEDCSAEERVQTLADWSAGFLAGFALSGKLAAKNFSTEVQESLKDLAEISQVGLSDDDDAHELDEQAWFEITEYVRLAVLGLFYECSDTVSATGQQQLH